MPPTENQGRVDLRKAEGYAQDGAYYTGAAVAAGISVIATGVKGLLKGLLPGIRDGAKVGAGKAVWEFPQSEGQKALPGRTYSPKCGGCRIVELDKDGDPII